MAFFGQGRDTIEWEEFRDDVLFYKWPAKEIKKGARLIIRQGQNAVFYANGQIEGIFKDPGSFDIATQITPFLSTLKGVFSLRGDTGMRAEVYFVNAKELLIPWGTRQRVMLPSREAPSGIPVGMNGNLIIEFRDYMRFIEKVAGVRSTYQTRDISERVMGEISPIIAECLLDGQKDIGAQALISLQANSRALGKKIGDELDKELMDIGLGVRDLNILAINYPKELEKMAEKVAAQSFVTDVGKYASVSLADSFGKGGGDTASAAAQMAMGFQVASQMMGGAPQTQPVQPQQTQQPQAGDKFCTKCRKMVPYNFCPDCGTQTV